MKLKLIKFEYKSTGASEASTNLNKESVFIQIEKWKIN